MTARPEQLLRHIRRLASWPAPDPGSDAELLRRFVGQRDEAAFAALVARHGPMVLGVCRRVLRDAHAAEDAAQAAFLALARKAATLRRPERLAAWLYGTARRLALSCQRADARRRRREARRVRTAPPGEPSPLDELTARELLAAVDEEVQRLPEAYRLPVLLCCLEGLSQEEAARRLGWTAGSVKGRLERGRARLHARLTRRGLTLTAALAAVQVTRGPAAALSARGAEAVVRAALAFTADGAAGAGVSAQAVSLAECGLEGLTAAKAKLGIALLTVGLALAGAGALAHQVRAARQPEARQEGPSSAPQVGAVAARPNDAAPTRGDGHDDPLPAGAIARLGTLRFRQGNWLYAIAVSPDGRLLAGVGGNNEVRLWDAATGVEQAHWPVPPGVGSPRAVVFAPDGRTLGVGASGGVVLLDVTLSKSRLLTPTGDTTGVAFAPDGKSVAASHLEGGVSVWDAATGRRLTSLRDSPNPGRSWSVAYSPDGRLLAWSEGWRVAVWDVRADKKLDFAIRHDAVVHAIAFSPDNKVLATGGEDRVVRLWATATGKPLRRMEGHAASVEGLAFSPDGKLLASGSGSADGVSHTEPRALRLWDAETGKELAALGAYAEGVKSVRFAHDGRVLYAAGNMSVRRWDMATRAEIPAGAGQVGWVGAIAFSPDGKTLATGGSDLAVHLWDFAKRKEYRVLTGNERTVDAVTYSPDGHRLACGCRDGRVLVWDTATGKEFARIRAGEPGWEARVAFSPDGKLLATGSRDGQIVLWDAATAREVRRFPRSEQGMMSLAFAPDGRRLATGHIDDRKRGAQDLTRLWDVAGGREVRRFATPRTLMVESIAFSPDGRLLAATEWGDTIHVWDAATGVPVRQLRGQRHGVNGVAFSPDGRMIASTGYDGTARLWETASGAERRRFRGHLGGATAPAFTTDGRTLATGGMDTTVILFSVRGPIARGQAPKMALSPQDLNALWQTLRGEDGVRAYEAVLALAAAPAGAVPYLRDRLRPARESQDVERLLAALDSDAFATREKAMAGLERLGEQA